MSVKRPNNLVSFGCLNPIQIKTKDGNTLTVPCRKCSFCRLHSASVLSSLGSLEALQNEDILFITLTYSNYNIPKTCYSITNTDINGSVDDDTLYNLTLFDSETGEISDDLICKKPSIDYVKKVSSYYKERFPVYFKENELPVLNFVHVRDFIKRLNSRCYRKFKKRSCFRYLYCGEYGPRTFRPHYHILLFCKSPEIRCHIYNSLFPNKGNCFKAAWDFGRTNAKFYIGHGADYITSYSQGLSNISALTSRSSFKSRCRHSKRFGFKGFEEQFKGIGPAFPPSYTSYNFVVDGKSKVLYPPHNFENTIYPRCRNFSVLSPSKQLWYYTISSWYASHFPKFGLNTPTLLSEHICNEIKDYTDYYGKLQIDSFTDTRSVIDLPYYIKVFGLHLLQYGIDKLYSMIYYDCLISFKFASVYDKYYKPFGSSFHVLVNDINKYYENKDIHFKLLDKKSIETLIKIDDEEALQYFEDDKQIKTDSWDYRCSSSFRAWTEYQNMRMYDFSKMKYLKDTYTNKPYTFQDL